MPPRLRPCLEPLEGRMLLSAVKAPLAAVEHMLNFAVPGAGDIGMHGIHAVGSQQASSVTLTLKLGYAGEEIRYPIQVQVATGPITTPPSTPVPSALPGVQYLP